LESQHPADPGNRQRLTQARSRLHVVHQGRQGPKGRSLAVVLLLVIAACSGGGHKAAPTTTTAPDSSESSQPPPTNAPRRNAADATWVGRGPTPLSSVVAAGGRFVYLGVDDQQKVQLVGLDPSTGKVAWERESTLANHVPGVEEHLVVEGTTVFNVEPSVGGASRVAFPAQTSNAADVVAVDARNGHDGWHVMINVVTTPLERCDNALCAFADAGSHFEVNRLDFATGNALSTGNAMFDPPVAENGEFAISASRATPDVELTSGYGKTVVWTKQHTDLFGTTDVSPNGGWSGFHVGGGWIIWLGSASPTGLGATSALADDGTLLWTKPDTSPCFALTGDPLTAPVLCGRVDAVARRLFLGTIQGVDPLTGNATWTLDAGDLDITKLGASLVRFDATHFGLHLASGDVALDLTTGPAGAPTTTSGWCETVGDIVPVTGGHSIVAMSWAPCTLGGGPDTTPPKAVPEFAGPTVDGFAAWVEDGEVRAAKVG